MGLLRGSWKVFRKDIVYELENKETLVILLVFSLAVVFIFNFSFNLSKEGAFRFLPGFLWMTILFASVLGFNKTMAFEKCGDGMSGLLLAPIPKEAVFLGKVASSFLFLIIAEVLITPLFFLFFGVKLSAKLFGLLALVLFLGSIGLAVIGSFLANICQVSKSSEILFSLGYFPMVVPILIGGTKLAEGILQEGQIPRGPWINLLITFDVVYLVICLLLFEYLVEE